MLPVRELIFPLQDDRVDLVARQFCNGLDEVVKGRHGEMLKATNGNAMRPAHIHIRVSAPRYDTLITHVFVAGDAWLEPDAVFGARNSCVANFIRHEADETMQEQVWVYGNSAVVSSICLRSGRWSRAHCRFDAIRRRQEQ